MEEDIFSALKGYADKPLAYFPSGNPAAQLGLTMSFYFGAPGFPERRRALVQCIQQYLHQARGMLRIYRIRGDRLYRKLESDEMPNVHRIIERSESKSSFWFVASGAEREDMSNLWSINTLAEDVERSTYLGHLLITYPLTIPQTQGMSLQTFIRQFVSFCDVLHVEHAYFGLGLILPLDPAARRAARRAIGPIAINRPGLDVDDPTGISIHCEEGIKSVNFLTAVSDRLLTRVGGAESVAAQAGPDITMYRYSTGAVFQAGSGPDIGYDPQTRMGVSPKHYVALGRVLKPIRAPYPDVMIYDPAIDDPMSDGHDAFTQRWLARFDGN